MRRKWTIIVLIVVGVFSSQLIIALWSDFAFSNKAIAAQKFTPETVESVPESFLKGGDRTVQALAELNKTMRENGRKLDKIAEKLDELNANLKSVAKER